MERYGDQRSRTRIQLAMALLSLSLMLACSPLPASAWKMHTQTAGGLTVQGTVADNTGRPMSGAYVDSDGLQTRTDHQGHYELHPAPSAHVFVTAWAPGYTRLALVFTLRDGAVLQGTALADFTGDAALSDAFRNPAFGATLKGLPVRMSSRVHVVHLHGTAAVPIESQVAVILPDGRVKTFPLHRKGTHFNAAVSVPQRGMYWVEVNATSGFAVFNVLVFRGERPHPPPHLSFPPEPRGQHVTSDLLERYALQLINNVRRTMGRPLLTMNKKLAAAAHIHNDDMIRYAYLSIHPHIGSDGSTPERRMAAAGFHVHACGEDVGLAYTVAQAMVSFLESPAHRAVLIGRYLRAGIGVTQLGTELMITVDLAR